MTNGPSRVVLITGASSGIGRATAELLAARGYQVFGGVRAPATTRPLAGVELVPLDVRDEVSVKARVEKVRSRAGRIDVLINNAGVNLVGAVEETSISQAQALFAPEPKVVAEEAAASDRRALPHATADRPGSSYELAAQAAAGPVVRAQPA
jgi:NAD(P)-dependent dehydrogenase (short-subunit alcohol dehydrogenase family)